MRDRGRSRHPVKKFGALGLLGAIYQRYGDPVGQIRHRGQNRTTDPLHYAPNMPPIPTFGHLNAWNFSTEHDVDTTNVWVETAVGGGSMAVVDQHGGYAKITNGGSDNNYAFYESKYEIARLQAEKDLWFRSHFIVGDVDEADVFVGLCTRLASGNMFDNRVDSIGFYLSDGSPTLNIETSKDGSATQTPTELSIGDGVEVGITIHVLNTTTVLFYAGVDGVEGDTYVGEHILTIPDDTELAFSFGVRNGTGSANTMSIGRTVLIQDE